VKCKFYFLPSTGIVELGSGKRDKFTVRKVSRQCPLVLVNFKRREEKEKVGVVRCTTFNWKTEINLRLRSSPGSARSSFMKRQLGEEVRRSRSGEGKDEQ
jgi:hypothetical protein